MLLYELGRWWTYRRIKHPMMLQYVWIVPMTGTLFFMAIYSVLPSKPPLIGQTGLLQSTTQLLALLPGFFISALAAVSTFSRPEMDEVMPDDPPPRVDVRHTGKTIVIDLTRRLFLSYLFSYLTVLSFLLFLVMVLTPQLHPSVVGLIDMELGSLEGVWLYLILKYAFMGITLYFMSSLFCSMLHGIYFLCERIHMPNR